MATAYIVPLITLPTIITDPGDYLTRAGEVVAITEVTTRHQFRCAGTYPQGMSDSWHKSGRLFAGVQSANDIIAKVSS